MAGFLYCVPGRRNLTRESAAEVGLAHAFESPVVSCNEIGRGGPGGAPGVICWAGADPRVAYAPDKQTWLPEPRHKRFWLGWDNAQPPAAADLARAQAYTIFVPVDLGDGRGPWILPCALRFDCSCPLPKVRSIDADTGEIVSRPEPRFDALRLAADRVADAVKSQTPLTAAEEFDTCVAALATNYRVGPAEVSALELCTDTAVDMICWALIDRFNWPDFPAKKET